MEKDLLGAADTGRIRPGFPTQFPILICPLVGCACPATAEPWTRRSLVFEYAAGLPTALEECVAGGKDCWAARRLAKAFCLFSSALRNCSVLMVNSNSKWHPFKVKVTVRASLLQVNDPSLSVEPTEMGEREFEICRTHIKALLYI